MQRWVRLGREAPLGAASAAASGVVSVALGAWLAAAGRGAAEIGLVGLVGLPWTLKPLWAPLLDRTGTRRRWLVGAQVAVVLALVGFALAWRAVPGAILAIAAGVAIAGATLDLAVDGWRVEAHAPEDREAATGVFVLGYRAGFLATGALAIPLAAAAGPTVALLAAAGVAALGLVASLGIAETPRTPSAGSLAAAWRDPIRALAAAPDAVRVLAIVALFKLGELPVLTLGPAFLVARGVAPGHVALAQTVALGATVLGALGAAGLAARLGARRALVCAGALQATTNLGYAGLAVITPGPTVVALVTGLDGLTGGLGAACFVAFLMGRCEPRWSAAHYALLSALSGLAGRLATPPLGALAEAAGWSTCFVAATACAIPALAVLALGSRRDG